MQQLNPIPALFISTQGALAPSGGGVQIYTQECIRALKEAGFRLRIVVCKLDRSLKRRLANRLLPVVYPPLWKSSFLAELDKAIQEEQAEYVFINQMFGRLPSLIREATDHRVKVIMLSFGLESVDYVHTLRIQARWGEIGRRSLWDGVALLGRQLTEEMRQREYIDQVICLAPFEAEIERWLGARKVGWVPRSVLPDSPLTWRPVSKRFGYVGTLDHPPNYDAVRGVFEELASRRVDGLEIRLIGGPKRFGQALSTRYPFVNYLGSLSDHDLETEASTWTAFLHPLFCFARGCSTKLAVALKWQIPIITTPEGCRGYVWESGELPMARSPSEFADWVSRLIDFTTAAKIREQVVQVARSSPHIEKIGAAIRQMLLKPDDHPVWRTDRSQV
jgi:hypothetical protein